MACAYTMRYVGTIIIARLVWNVKRDFSTIATFVWGEGGARGQNGGYSGSSMQLPGRVGVAHMLPTKLGILCNLASAQGMGAKAALCGNGAPASPPIFIKS